MQKQQYLPGFLQHACKNSNIYKVFCDERSKTPIFTRFSATHIQKQQYLQGFLQKTCKNINILKDFCNTHTKTAILIRRSATSVQKHQYLLGFLQHTCKNRACPICVPELSQKCRRAVLWLPLADSIESGI